MREFILQGIPSKKEINTAFHQDEGIYLQTIDGKTYVLSIQDSLNPKGIRVILGKCSEVVDGKIAIGGQDGHLTIYDIATPEPLGVLTII